MLRPGVVSLCTQGKRFSVPGSFLSYSSEPPNPGMYLLRLGISSVWPGSSGALCHQRRQCRVWGSHYGVGRTLLPLPASPSLLSRPCYWDPAALEPSSFPHTLRGFSTSKSQPLALGPSSKRRGRPAGLSPAPQVLKKGSLSLHGATMDVARASPWHHPEPESPTHCQK